MTHEYDHCVKPYLFAPRHTMKRIAHFGIFDRDSYGYQILPKLVEYLLPDFAITHVAPIAARTEWSDSAPVISVNEAIGRTDWDGVLVGGGDIVQTGEWLTQKWHPHQAQPFCGFPGLWMGAAFISAKFNIPVVWNAPGVPAPFPGWFTEFAELALDCTDYLAVRDDQSRANIEPLTRKPIAVIPDSALAIARMWPSPVKRRRLVLSLSRADTTLHATEVNEAIGELAQRMRLKDEDIVVVPLTRWESEKYPTGSTSREPILAQPALACASLESAAHLIGGSAGYIGNSLHGMITAISYGVPAVLVAPHHNQQYLKHRGVLDALGLDPARHLAAHWSQACDLLLCQPHSGITDRVFSKFSYHVEKVRTLLNAGSVDKTGLWKQITSKLHEDSEKYCLLGTPPGHLAIYSKANGQRLNRCTEQAEDVRRDLALAKTREQALEQALNAWQNSCAGRLSRLANAGLHVATVPLRWFRYLTDSKLRALLLNAVERRWIQLLDRRKLKDLPDLEWLLATLELQTSPEEVIAKIGPYLTRREEACYRDMIGPLRAAGRGRPSRVCRPGSRSLPADKASARRSILFVCGEFPNPIHGGGSRVADFIRATSVNHDVHVAAWYRHASDAAAWAALAPYCQSLLRLSFEDLERGCADAILKSLDGIPVDIVHYEWPRSLRSFDRRLGRHHIYTHMEVVSCSLWMDIRRLPPLSPLWLQRLAQLFTMLRVEILEAACADAQIVVTEKDGAFLSRFAAGRTFHVVNHGINRAEFNVPDSPPQQNTLVFTGNFTHYPNLDAVSFFMREIHPLILEAVPDATVMFVGANPPASVVRLHGKGNVIVTGRVPDIRPYIQKAAVCIAPLISGAGLRTKVVQYAALRRPCVATSIAAEDLEFENGREIMIADDPEAFAAHVVKLLLNPGFAASIAEAAHRRAMASYDNNTITAQALGGLYRILDAEEGNT
jgi:glycosyltransferase involved in cell wall biosynthesis/polysaccharide pyruvyl transferase WcaK-like protein